MAIHQLLKGLDSVLTHDTRVPEHQDLYADVGPTKSQLVHAQALVNE